MTQTEAGQGFFPPGYKPGQPYGGGGPQGAQGVAPAGYVNPGGRPDYSPHATNPYAQFSSDSALLWGLEKGGANQEVLNTVAQNTLNQIAQNPGQVGAFRAWANAAPVIPAGAHLALAQSGIAPNSELGQWLIRSAVPAFSTNQTWQDHTPADMNAVFDLVSDPDRLAMLQRLPVDKLSNVLRHGPWNVGKLSDPQLQSLTQTGNLPDAGWKGYVADVTRPVFTALQGGYEALQMYPRQVAGQELALAGSLKKGDIKGAAGHFEVLAQPGTAGMALEQAGVGTHGQLEATLPTGAKVSVGTSEQVLNPGQITAVQALEGKNLGSGFFPGGEAVKAQASAAQAAANINGHALTPGRALASLITTPGTKAYSILSGATDFTVALEADPANISISQLSEAARGSRLFSSTTEEAIASTADHLIEKLGPENADALRSWALPNLEERYGGAISRGAAGRDLRGAIVNKLTEDPGSLQQLVDQGVTTHREVLSAIAGKDVGLLDGLRRTIHPQSALEWLNAPSGVKFAAKAAGMTGTDIYLRSGKKIPADVAWQLGDAQTPDAVREVLAGAIGTDLQRAPYMWKHPLQDMRAFSLMPNHMVDSEDANQMIDRAIQDMQIGKVPKAEWDGYLKPIAHAQDRIDSFNAFKNIGNRIGDEILNRLPHYQENLSALQTERARVLASGVEDQAYRSALGKVNAQKRIARDLVNYWPKNAEAERKGFIDLLGDHPEIPGMALDGQAAPVASQYMLSELLNQGIPVLGGNGMTGLRDVKRAVSIWAPVWNNPMVGDQLTKASKGATYMFDWLTQAFKIGVLARLALPVRFLADEHARMATAGIDSFFSNPMSYIAHVVGSKNAEDILGEKWIDHLAEAKDVYTQSVGRTRFVMEELRGNDEVFAKGWTPYVPGDKGYEGAWLDRLSQAHVDPIGRAVAKALVDPVETGGMDAVKNAFATGNLQRYRDTLVRSKLSWGSENLINRAQSDAYVDGVASILDKLTANGHPDLMNAVANGEPWKGEEANRELRGLVTNLHNQELGPERVVGRNIGTLQQQRYMNRATNAMFSALMGQPTGKLTRSPAFREFYFNRLQELMPHLDEETRASVLDAARTNKIKMFAPSEIAAGEKLTLEQADTLAKASALKQTHDLLYYPNERMSAVDKLRNIIPFGNAWKNLLTTWVHLTMSHPEVIRRVQQGVTAARESGWWYTDPQDGIEKFTIVPGEAMKHLTGVPFPMVGQVKGLNLLAQGIPGAGPAIAFPASMILQHVNNLPAEDTFRKWALPYGDPEFVSGGGFIESLFPGWIDKLRATGYFVRPTADQSRILDNVAKQVMDYKMSTGKYDWHDPDVLHKVWLDSVGDAKKLYFWRGLAQFVSPAAPSYINQVKLKDGALIETSLVAQDYNNMIQANGGDSYQATLQFVKKYGPDLVFATQPMSYTTVTGLPTTAEAEAWATTHSGFAAKYKNLYGYWAPAGGTFDRNAYLQQIARGQRVSPSGADWYTLATSRLGNAVYDQYRKQVGASPNPNQQAWLDNIRQQMSTEGGGAYFPGFNEDYLKRASNRTDQTMIELQNAIHDPSVKGSPLTNALTVYLDYRNQALASANAGGLKSLQGKGADGLRSWLFNIGDQIATKIPEFQTMWNYLLSSEVDPRNQ